MIYYRCDAEKKSAGNALNGLNVLNSQSLTNFVTLRVDPPSGVLCPQTWIY